MSELVYSLHEFLIMTKGISVLLAIGLAVLFIVFWNFLTDKEDEGKTRLEPRVHGVRDVFGCWVRLGELRQLVEQRAMEVAQTFRQETLNAAEIHDETVPIERVRRHLHLDEPVVAVRLLAPAAADPDAVRRAEACAHGDRVHAPLPPRRG